MAIWEKTFSKQLWKEEKIMANIGYIRVSTYEQNTDRQLHAVPLDKVFEEKISAAAQSRPALKSCMDYLREGDTLHVHSIDRLARSLIELQTTVQELNNKGVAVHFHAENMLFPSKSEGAPAPMQELLFQILGAFAQFERNLIRERQQEGIERAKKEGRKLGRPSKISEKDKATIREKFKAGASPAAIAEEMGVNVWSVYKLCKADHEE